MAKVWGKEKGPRMGRAGGFVRRVSVDGDCGWGWQTFLLRPRDPGFRFFSFR